MTSISRVALAVAVVLAVQAGCSRFYYAAMEKIGKEKREILAGRVEGGQKAQERAKEQFQTTLEAFQDLTGFEGGDLEKVYKKLNREYERSEKRAGVVRERIRSIEDVARRLFREWEEEISEIENRRLRTRSQELLERTVDRYRVLIEKMKDAEESMEPVLTAYRDQVLFLKHNLNAQAIESLKSTVVEINDDVASLIAELEDSIQEADDFIESLES